jgi:septum formation protein
MFILASGSPRRKQILALAGWTFSTASADIDERPLAGESPGQYVLRLALAKADAVRSSLAQPDGAMILAADTTVALEGEILGKPGDAGEAEAMLLRLRGRRHQVYTALALLQPARGLALSDVCETQVWMRSYHDQEMQAYIATGDPMDKAGAYAIQHAVFRPVEALDGCYANVVGLPLCRLSQLFEQARIDPQQRPPAVCQGAGGQPCRVAGWVLGQSTELDGRKVS